MTQPIEPSGGDEPASTITVRVVDDPAGARAELAPIELAVIAGPDAGATFTAETERVAIGTHERADLILRDRTVSRFHAEIAIEGQRVVIRDLGSHNGTLVDGVSIVLAHLRADLLERHGGNVSAAARAAGVDRKHFYRLLWRHGLR